MQHNATKQSGFTLIEMLVAIAIFSVVAVIAVSTLLSLVDANRKARSLETSINNAFFALESVTRLVRTGAEYRCDDDDAGETANCNGGDSFWFTDDTDRRIRVHLSDGTIMQTIDGTARSLTADDIDIERLRFFVSGTSSGPGDGEQPIVTLILQGVVAAGTDHESEVDIQTTVTQRVLDL
jgi:prepilin-type N-terminal cleavage/methylation domain-containing protein